MIEFTPTARERFDDYMRRLHLSLGGRRNTEAEDVEQSVREHIEIALSDVQAPVPADRLVAVLDRLGDPERWAAGDQPWWRRVMMRLRFGPEDWRLAYIAFGLFVLSFLLMPIGVFLIIASFIASRAYIEFMTEKGEQLGARRWLVYPPIALILAVCVGFFIVGPAGPATVIGFEEDGYRQFAQEFVKGPVHEMQFAAGATAAIFGTWWIVGSLLLMVVLRPVRFIFSPLIDRVRPRHVAVLTGIGVLVLAAGLLILRPYLPFVY